MSHEDEGAMEKNIDKQIKLHIQINHGAHSVSHKTSPYQNLEAKK